MFMNASPLDKTTRSSSHQHIHPHCSPRFSCKLKLCTFQSHHLYFVYAWAPSTNRRGTNAFRKIISLRTANREVFVSFTMSEMYYYLFGTLFSQQRVSVPLLPLGLSTVAGEELFISRGSISPLEGIPTSCAKIRYNKEKSKQDKSIQPYMERTKYRIG